MEKLHARLHFKKLASDVGHCPNTASGHVDFARIGLRIVNKLRHRLCGNGWVNLHHLRCAYEACDRRDVLGEIKSQVTIQRRVDRIYGCHNAECVTVWGSLSDGFDCEVGTGAWPVLNDER